MKRELDKAKTEDRKKIDDMEKEMQTLKDDLKEDKKKGEKGCNERFKRITNFSRKTKSPY